MAPGYTSDDLSPASTACDLLNVDSYGFRGSECQRIEDVVRLDMLVHLLAMLFRTILNAAHAFLLLLLLVLLACRARSRLFAVKLLTYLRDCHAELERRTSDESEAALTA